MELTCNSCGREYEAARSDSRYCSPRCRTAEHRKRTAPKPTKPRRRTPLPDRFLTVVVSLSRDTEELRRLVADDRMPANRERLADYHVSDLLRFRNQIDGAIEALRSSST